MEVEKARLIINGADVTDKVYGIVVEFDSQMETMVTVQFRAGIEVLRPPEVVEIHPEIHPNQSTIEDYIEPKTESSGAMPDTCYDISPSSLHCTRAPGHDGLHRANENGVADETWLNFS